MMKILLGLFLLFSTFTQAQESTLLYNENRQLIADTSLQLSISEFENWKGIENHLIREIIIKLKYSAVAIDNNLQGNSVISFEIDKNGDVVNFTRLKSVGGGLEERLKIIISSFSLLDTLKLENGISAKYYLSLEFNLIDIKQEIKETGVIPIGGNRFSYRQY